MIMWPLLHAKPAIDVGDIEVHKRVSALLEIRVQWGNIINNNNTV